MDVHQQDKLDLYSVPVFVLELIILIGLAFAAHHIHFQHKHEPYLTGFYCDDISIRNEFRDSKLTEHFERNDNELVVLSLLLIVPIVVIIFCELVNSMFGSLKFRRIRALCKCCKLHSITRRTIRFSGAYILGFLIVMISSDILANTTGRLKPYFAQECPNAFRTCQFRPPSLLDVRPGGSQAAALLSDPPSRQTMDENTSGLDKLPSGVHPLSAPIQSNATTAITNPLPESLARNRRDVAASGSVDKRLLERQWVVLDGANLDQLCDFSGGPIQRGKFDRIAMSWPSFPASIVSYAALYVAAYLSFIGTARPFRVITSVLVVVLLLVATIFDVQLVREHYNHWEDSLSGAVLALMVVVLVLFVYLNKFRDSHYYNKQKTMMKRRTDQNISSGYSNEIAMEQYNLDKTDEEQGSVSNMNNNNNNSSSNHISNNNNNIHSTDAAGSVPNNDFAMRYFQIPRANYRGVPRPVSRGVVVD